MSAYQPLNCDQHDYLEIACMRSYSLNIELKTGELLWAKALTTRTSPDKEEFLVVDAGGELIELRLDRLQAITPLNAGAGFSRIEFG